MAANFIPGHALWPELTRGHDRLRMEENARRILGARTSGGAHAQCFFVDQLERQICCTLQTCYAVPVS